MVAMPVKSITRPTSIRGANTDTRVIPIIAITSATIEPTKLVTFDISVKSYSIRN